MDLTELYKLIKKFEGCILTPYICPAGVWTCGWGSTGRDIFPGRPWSQEYADKRMDIDANKFARATKVLCPKLEEDALCAIADFSYNLGIGNLKTSTLRRKINADDMDGIKQELRKWVHSKGRKLFGLVLRREAECNLLN